MISYRSPSTLHAPFVMLLILLLVGCSRPPPLPYIAEEGVILAFGDSLTWGTGAAPEASYPAQLAQLTGRRVVNGGVPGELSGTAVARLPLWLEKHQPDLLILCHGGNDLLRRRSRSELVANLRQMVELAQARQIPVVLMGVPDPGLPLFLSVADLYAELTEALGLVDVGEVIAEVLSRPSLKADAVHPNGEGYRRIAEAVYATLRDGGAI
jgi:acyl-CoA thioesterase I